MGFGVPTIEIPTLHAGQVKIYKERSRRNVIRCGRRFGKTKMSVAFSCNAAANGKKVGLFAPEHKQLQEPYDEILAALKPITASSNKTDGVIKTTTGGKVDFWRLTDNELAGRGREYDLVIIDEAAFTKNGQMVDIWNKSIVPTMATRPKATVWVLSTPRGIDEDNFFWKLCHDPDFGFKEFHAPSWSNPIVSSEWLESEKKRMHPDVWRQEVLAEFVSWDGAAFFSLEKLLQDGKPVEAPTRCDAVFAVIDSATKAGKEHDGTAVMFFAQNNIYGTPLIVLDWDYVQIEGALLETWLPTIFQKLEHYAKVCGARHGSLGVWIEDKASGMVLNQQALRHGWPSQAIDSKLTSVGKEERAISVSGYVWQEMVKLSTEAYDKTLTFKGVTKNHMLAQVIGFRIGQKDQADDLFDCFCYSIALALGNSDGF